MKMITKYIRFLYLFVLFFITPSIWAQQEDFQSRLGVGVSGDIDHSLGWDFKIEQRWKSNAIRYDRTLLQGALSYDPFSFLSIGAGYRASFMRKYDERTVYKQRLQTDVELKHKVERLKLIYRSRLQYGFNDFQSFESTASSTFVWRHRIGLKYYPFGLPIRPSISAEIFQNFSNDEGPKVDGVRYIVGVDYLLSQDFSIGLSYLINKEINVSDPLTEYILSVGLDYKF